MITKKYRYALFALTALFVAMTSAYDLITGLNYINSGDGTGWVFILLFITTMGFGAVIMYRLLHE